MGYESKVYIFDRCEHKNVNGEKYVGGDFIAVFDLCKLGYERHACHVRNSFTEPIDFGIWINEEETREDAYGDVCKYCKPNVLLAALKDFEDAEHYRRIPPLIGFLESLNEAEYDDIVCVHYGY